MPESPVERVSFRGTPRSFAVSFRFGHSKVTKAALIRITTFLLPYDGNFDPSQLGKTANQSRIVRVTTVAVKLDEIFEDR